MKKKALTLEEKAALTFAYVLGGYTALGEHDEKYTYVEAVSWFKHFCLFQNRLWPLSEYVTAFSEVEQADQFASLVVSEGAKIGLRITYLGFYRKSKEVSFIVEAE